MSGNPSQPEHSALVRLVLEGYREGAFPMAIAEEEDGEPELGWYEADPRGVIRLEPGAWRVPRRLARTVRSRRFEVTCDASFGSVIGACADPRREGGWIDERIIAIFEELHDAGIAHCVEAWVTARDFPSAPAELLSADGQRLLVGGVYGLQLGAIFCGESMFSRPDLGGRDASKVCLVHLMLHLVEHGFELLDTQMWSEHVAQFGCESISRSAYTELLERLRDQDRSWGRFDAAAHRAGVAEIG